MFLVVLLNSYVLAICLSKSKTKQWARKNNIRIITVKFERDNGYFCGVKILFVANRVPYPPYRGDKLKIFNLAKQLSSSHELHLITIAEDTLDLSYKDKLTPYFKTIEMVYLPKWKRQLNVFRSLFNRKPLQVNYFSTSKFQNLVQSIHFDDFDAIHVQHLRMSQFFDGQVPPQAILDLPDAFSLYWKRRKERAKNPFIKWFNALEYHRLLKFEQKILPQFGLNLVCNQEDKEYLSRLQKGKKSKNQVRIDLLPNGVDTDTFSRKHSNMEPLRVLFTGNMNYAPNVDGVHYFTSEIWPLVLREVPNATFIIAGQKPVESVKLLASDTIEVTGFIEDLAHEYTKAQVLVAPLRFGAGTQNKVLEAMASAVPVVCTDIGFQGLNANQGQGIWSFTKPFDFATQLIVLLNDLQLAKSKGLEGEKIIKKHFSWNSISSKLSSYFKEMDEKKGTES